MNTSRLIRNFYVLPCCILLLNLCVGVVSYKAQTISSHMLRVAAIMAMVLFGSSFIGFVMEPVIERTVVALHHHSRRRGRSGEIIFLTILGCLVFWLYYRMYIFGPRSILPQAWWN